MEASKRAKATPTEKLIPTWHFYLYALCIIGAAVLLMVLTAILIPEPRTSPGLGNSRDMSGKDAGLGFSDGGPSHDRK